MAVKQDDMRQSGEENEKIFCSYAGFFLILSSKEFIYLKMQYICLHLYPVTVILFMDESVKIIN